MEVIVREGIVMIVDRMLVDRMLIDGVLVDKVLVDGLPVDKHEGEFVLSLFLTIIH